MAWWTRKRVDNFIIDHPISTGGAMSSHAVVVEDKDDGDVWTEVTLDYWPNNDRVVAGVLKFMSDAFNASPSSTQIYLGHNKVRVLFFSSFCDPD